MAARLQFVLALFVVGCQGWKLPAIPAGRRAQFYTQQSDGAYKYGYDTAEGLFQVQEADPANEVRGKFGADGGKIEYTAGVDGFVVTSHKKGASRGATSRRYYPAHTNSAAVRFATLKELNTLPKPVVDTLEVVQAKAKFHAAYNAAAAKAEAAPDINIITAGIKTPSSLYNVPPIIGVQSYQVHPVVTIAKIPSPVEVRLATPVRFATLEELNTLPKPVVDTPEVAKAKAQFKAAYDAAAAAAEAAPDVNIITGAVPVVVPAVHNTYLAPAEDLRYSGPLVTLDAFGNVEETAEVKAARAQFKAAYDAAAAAAAAAPDVNIITGAVPVVIPAVQNTYLAPAEDLRYSGPLVTLDAFGNVEETAEVKAAKAQFQAAYDAAAAAAAAAPDVQSTYYSTPAVQFTYLAPANPTHYSGPVLSLDSSGHVQDTAEVKAAKQAFRAAYNAAAAAAEAAPDVNIITGPPPVSQSRFSSGFTYRAPASKSTFFVPQTPTRYSGHVVSLDASGRVEDTPEVKAAKHAFQAAYDAAAAAAEAAPDTGIITAPVTVVRTQTYPSGYRQQVKAAHHGNNRIYSFDGITVMQADGATSPAKFGYTYD